MDLARHTCSRTWSHSRNWDSTSPSGSISPASTRVGDEPVFLLGGHSATPQVVDVENRVLDYAKNTAVQRRRRG